jgi:hypothetical protein
MVSPTSALDAEANQLLQQTYRKPFELPEA